MGDEDDEMTETFLPTEKESHADGGKFGLAVEGLTHNSRISTSSFLGVEIQPHKSTTAVCLEADDRTKTETTTTVADDRGGDVHGEEADLSAIR